MNVTRIAVLAVALIAGIAAAMLMRGMLGGGTPASQASVTPAVVTVDVLVAASSIAPGQALDTSLVRWQAWPKTAVADGFIVQDAEPDIAKVVAGIVARAPLVAGQPVTETAIVRAGAAGFLAATIKSGMRAISLPVRANTGAGGFILPNDRVDVVLTRDISNGGAEKNFQSMIILSDVRVLAVDQTAQQQKDQQSVVAETATLELMPVQAELLARSQQEGIISLALRALGDSNGEPVTEVASRRAPPSIPRIASNGPSVTVFRYGVRGGGDSGASSEGFASVPGAAGPAVPAGTAPITNPNPVSINVAPSAGPLQ